MPQMAPLSLAEETDRPVEIRFWVVCSSEAVMLRFCSAMMAPVLVLMLFVDITSRPLFQP